MTDQFLQNLCSRHETKSIALRGEMLDMRLLSAAELLEISAACGASPALMEALPGLAALAAICLQGRQLLQIGVRRRTPAWTAERRPVKRENKAQARAGGTPALACAENIRCAARRRAGPAHYAPGISVLHFAAMAG